MPCARSWARAATSRRHRLRRDVHRRLVPRHRRDGALRRGAARRGQRGGGRSARPPGTSSRLTAGARTLAVSTVVAMVGAGMFLGDSVITPAVSVLSATEGLEVASPSLKAFGAPRRRGRARRGLRPAALRQRQDRRGLRPDHGAWFAVLGRVRRRVAVAGPGRAAGAVADLGDALLRARPAPRVPLPGRGRPGGHRGRGAVRRPRSLRALRHRPRLVAGGLPEPRCWSTSARPPQCCATRKGGRPVLRPRARLGHGAGARWPGWRR